MNEERVLCAPQNDRSRHASLPSLLTLFALALGSACGGDDPAAGGSTPGGGGRTGSSSGSASGSGAAECKSLRAPTIVVDDIGAGEFALSRDELFFVDPDAGTLMKHSVKGGAGTMLVKFDDSAVVGTGTFVDGDDVYFMMGTAKDDEDNLPIHRVSRTGGAASKLSTGVTSEVPTGIGIFASDETSLYTTDYDTAIMRVSKETGEAEYVIKDHPDLSSPQLYEGKIYFSDVTNGDILAIDKDASDGKTEVVLKEACDILYSLSVSKSRIACGLDVYDWEGKKTNFLDDTGRLAVPTTDSLFGYSNDVHTLSQVKFDPFESQLLACDVYSDVTVLRATETDLYWLNNRTVDKKVVRSISRIAVK